MEGSAVRAITVEKILGTRTKVAELLKSDEFKRKMINKLMSVINNNKKVIIAYSGGADSALLLYKLFRELSINKSKTIIVTLDHGFKTERVKENIYNVIEDLGLYENFEHINISDKIMRFIDKESKIKCIYLYMITHKRLPCSLKICGYIYDIIFSELSMKYRTNVIITGSMFPVIKGDTLDIINKRNGLTIVRGMVPFAMPKHMVINELREIGSPWKNPNIGGYDTDCIVPGYLLYMIYRGKRRQNFWNVYVKTPEVIHYVSNYVKFGLLSKEEALKYITNLDLPTSSVFSYMESIVERMRLECEKYE